MIFGFAHGFFAPFRAMAFLRRHKRLLRYIFIPFIINVAVFSGCGWLGFRFFNQVVDAYLPSGDAW